MSPKWAELILYNWICQLKKTRDWHRLPWPCVSYCDELLLTVLLVKQFKHNFFWQKYDEKTCLKLFNEVLFICYLPCVLLCDILWLLLHCTSDRQRGGKKTNAMKLRNQSVNIYIYITLYSILFPCNKCACLFMTRRI